MFSLPEFARLPFSNNPALNAKKPMDILERIRQRAAAKPQHIVLPEGNDPRTVVAAGICARHRLARITLLGDETKIREMAQQQQVELGGVEVVDHRRAA